MALQTGFSDFALCYLLFLFFPNWKNNLTEVSLDHYTSDFKASSLITNLSSGSTNGSLLGSCFLIRLKQLFENGNGPYKLAFERKSKKFFCLINSNKLGAHYGLWLPEFAVRLHGVEYRYFFYKNNSTDVHQSYACARRYVSSR